MKKIARREGYSPEKQQGFRTVPNLESYILWFLQISQEFHVTASEFRGLLSILMVNERESDTSKPHTSISSLRVEVYLGSLKSVGF